jgi:hypothetical protein
MLSLSELDVSIASWRSRAVPRPARHFVGGSIDLNFQKGLNAEKYCGEVR